MNSKLNVLFYGSCYCVRLFQTDINGRSFFGKVFENCNVTVIACYETEIKEDEFNKIIETSDIIITQPMNDNYRDRPYLSMKNVLNKASKTSTILVIPQLDFTFYYFDYGNISNNGINIAVPPNTFHMRELFNYYKGGLSIENFLKNVYYNGNFKNTKEIEEIADTSFSIVADREKFAISRSENYKNSVVIPLETFYRREYKNNRLTYTINHPSPFLMKYIAVYIVNVLKLNENDLDLNCDPFLDSVGVIRGTPPMYACIKKYVNFDTENYIPCFRSLSENGENLTVERACEIYYTAYDTLKIK